MRWLLNLIKCIQKYFKKDSGYEKITLSEATSWLENLKEDTILNAELKEELKLFKKKFEEKRFHLENQLEVWQRKIPSIKQDELRHLFLEVRKFLNLLVIPEEFDKALQLNSYLDIKGEEILKKMEDSYFAYDYSYLLEEEEKNQQIINPLLKELLEVNGLRESFEQKINQCGLHIIKKLEHKVILLNSTKERLQELSLILKEKENRKMQLQQKKVEKENLIAELKNDPNFESLNDAEREREFVTGKRDELKKNILSIFSRLKPFLEHCHKFNSDEIILGYLDDPFSAFAVDEKLAVAPVLQELRLLLISGRIECPEEKRYSFINLLEKLDRTYLEKMRKNVLLLRKKLENLQSVSMSNDITLKLSDVQYRLNHFMELFENLKKEISYFEEEMEEKQNLLNREKESFQNLVKMGFQKKVKLLV